jgi:hypothetical protein
MVGWRRTGMSGKIEFKRFVPADVEKSSVMGVHDIVVHAEEIASEIEAENLEVKRRQVAEEMEKAAQLLSGVNERMLVLSLILKCGIRKYDGTVVRGKELYRFLVDRLQEMSMDPESFEHYHTMNDLLDAHGMSTAGGAIPRAASVFGSAMAASGVAKSAFAASYTEPTIGKDVSDSEFFNQMLRTYADVQEQKRKDAEKELPF